jgi:hypothetical protein
MSDNEGVRLTLLLAFAGLLTSYAGAATSCTGREVGGSYGLQLSGLTTISGVATPIAVLARLVFDGEKSIAGSSSVNFNGLLLGNPVTGTYEVKPDCTMSLSLQDDSGAFQHFGGTVAPGGGKVVVRQTDPDTGEGGILVRTAAACQATDVRARYAFTLSGAYTPLAPGGVSGAISAKGVIEADPSGKFTLSRDSATAEGTFEVDPDCIVRFEFLLPADGAQAAIPMKLRGILVDESRQILAIHTDPSAVVSAKFTAR